MMNLNDVLWKKDDTYVIKEVHAGAASQGHTMDGAIYNIKEAMVLYLEEEEQQQPSAKKSLVGTNLVGALNVEIS